MTNGEYLRSLSDEELGKRICDLFGGCNVCLASEHCSVGHNGLVAWAKEESDILPFDRQNSQTTCKDCVSRQEAIDAVRHAWAKGLEPTQFLEDLPSAQPDIKQAAKLLSDFIESCPGGDSYLITPDGEELRTDWGYAMEGIQLIYEWEERRTDE